MANHGQETSYKCLICSIKFKREVELKMHEQLHTGQRTFKCILCDKSYDYFSTFSKHMKSCVGDRHRDNAEPPFKCSICLRSFDSKRSLTPHMRAHTGGRTFCCFNCGKSFVYKATLSKHILICSTSNKSSLTEKCPICAAHLNIIDWAKHVEEHSKRFFCTLYNKPFSQYSTLPNHMRSKESVFKHDRTLLTECDESLLLANHTNSNVPSTDDHADPMKDASHDSKPQTIHFSNNPFLINIKVEKDTIY